MGIWFRKTKSQKWHLANYGGSIAECGRDIKVAACHAIERMEIEVDKADGIRDYCQACVNSIKRGREYIKEFESKR